MVNKKQLLFTGLCLSAALQPTFAQESGSAQSSWSGRDMTYHGQGYDALDTTKIPQSRMQQQTAYLNHQYDFPARPRDMWEIGINAGFSNVFGDVTSKTPFTAAKPFDAVGFGATIRKALGYSTSIRLQYIYGRSSGFDYRGRLTNEGAWSAYPQGANNYSNYRMQSHELTLQLVGAINNIRFHKAKNSMSLYGFIGAGGSLWQTRISTQKKDGSLYDFAQLDGESAKDRKKDYKKWLKDADYNYVVNRNEPTSNGIGDWTAGKYQFSPVITGGVGIQFKLGSRVSLNFEEKLTWYGSDKLDGVTLEPTLPVHTGDKDMYNYASVGLSFNLGSASKRVQPLWWVNPLNHVYDELSSPRHMILPDPVLSDDDHDGVANQFDLEPNTPAGVFVDTHGRALDTDGDGVPDYKDHELITPTACQPVDADGVGKCPDPECCKGVHPQEGCGNISTGAVSFKANSAALSATAKAQLDGLAAQAIANPDCKLVITGDAGKNKPAQQRSWDRVNAVINYLSEEKQVARDRFIFQYDGVTGDANTILYRAAQPNEEGPSNVARPHPQYGSTK